MQKVTIKQDGIYFSYWEEDEADWIDRNINEANLPLSWYLPYAVKMEDGLTIRTILSHLSFYKEQIEDNFSNALHGLSCKTVEDLIRGSGEPITDQINYLYLFKIGEVIPASEEYKLIRKTPVIMGLFIKDDIESEDVYHLSSFPIEEWVDLPISIDYFMEYLDTDEDEVVLSGLTTWQFFEIIHTILAQISLTLRITETLPTTASLESGPLTISELFDWINELDHILLV